MTDMTNSPQVAPTKKRHHVPRREYIAYFALIFLATLPLAFLTWVLSAARRMELPERGPIKNAWSQAQIITPRIFSA
ncbi:MAG: cytochrome PufQ [Pseudomonadota bacterium]